MNTTSVADSTSNYHLWVCVCTDELLLLCVIFNLFSIYYQIQNINCRMFHVVSVLPCNCYTCTSWNTCKTLAWIRHCCSHAQWSVCSGSHYQDETIGRSKRSSQWTLANVNFDYIEIVMICICCRWNMLGPLLSFLSPCLSKQMVFKFGKTLFVVSTCVFVVSSITV